jgi:formate dehydrogenase maturation protein FdhE
MTERKRHYQLRCTENGCRNTMLIDVYDLPGGIRAKCSVCEEIAVLIPKVLHKDEPELVVCSNCEEWKGINPKKVRRFDYTKLRCNDCGSFLKKYHRRKAE